VDRNTYKDGMTIDGARRLVKIIQDFWHAKGLYPLVWTEEVGALLPVAERHVVRSNMIKGLPR